ncbi:ProQ/FINO family protein [Halomonas sp. CH40]
MSASVMQLLDDLEARLKEAQQVIAALEAQNRELTSQLAESTPVQPPVDEPSVDETSTDQADASPQSPDSIPTPPSPHQLLDQWYERYPQAFFKGRTQPLKVGIHQDLADREPWSNKLIRRALANYVNLPRYIKAMREGVERVDLEGNSAGVVDAQAAEFAAQKRKANQQTQPPEATRLRKQPGKKISGKPYSEKQHSAKRAEVGKMVSKKTKPHNKAAVEPQKKYQEEFADTPQTTDFRSQPLSMEEKLASLQAKFKAR